jgi:hypothetical protein
MWKLSLFALVLSIYLGFGIYHLLGWLPPLLPDLEFGRSSFPETIQRYVVLFVWLFLTYWVSVFVHELGHAFFGYFAGFSFHFIRIGKFSFAYEQRKWRIYYVSEAPWFNNIYYGFPRDERNLQKRWIFMCLGGVLLNLLVAVLVICIIVFWFGRERIELWNVLQNISPDQARQLFRSHPIQADIQQNILGAGLVCLVFCNLGSVVNLFPDRDIHGNYSDGLSIYHAFQNQSQFQQDMGILLLFGAMHHQIPVKQWKPKWIEMSLKNPVQTLQYANALYLAHVFSVDTDNIEQSRVYIHQIRAIGEYLNWKDIQGFTLELAWFTAWHEQNSEQAKIFMEIGKNADLPTFIKKRAEAAIAFAEGKLTEAQELVQAGLKDYQERGSPYLGAFEARGLEDMRLQM